MYYKATDIKQGFQFVYPVPNVDAIKGAKYRKDLKECVFYYPESISAQNLTRLSEAEYESYPKCRINLNKSTLSVGENLHVTLNTPDYVVSDQLVFYVNDEIKKFLPVTGQQTEFDVLIDESLSGKIVAVSVETNYWRRSEQKLIEIIG